MPPTREEIIQAHRAVAERFAALASGLSEPELAKEVYPGWPAKDVLGHLAGSSAAGAFFVGLARSGRGGMSRDFDLDGFNARQVAERRARAVAELVAEFRAGHEASLKALADASDDLLSRQIDSDVGVMPLAEMLHHTAAEHDATHLDDIERALRR